MPEGPPKTAPKILEQQLIDLREIQRALAEAREAGDVAAAEALMEQHRDAVEPMEASTSPGESPEGATLADAERILGKESILGPKAVEQVFGVKLDRIPAIPFSQQELQRAKELGQQLIFYTDALSPTTLGEKVKPLTLANLKQKFTKAHDDGKVFYEQDWYKNEDFFKKEKPRVGWRLTSKDLLPESTSKNYLEQTDVLIEYLQKQVFKGAKLPKPYEDAIAEWKREREKIEPLATSSTDTEWKCGSQMLTDLAITKLTRELPIEVMYRFILNDQINKDKPLPSAYTWTASRSSGGYLVHVGGFGDAGALVSRGDPGARHDNLGVSFSRS
ncbi:MAG: hypothetical protein AAB442_01280 [Patescibacteria group bacterium]